jgi:hypothetical protein
MCAYDTPCTSLFDQPYNVLLPVLLSGDPEWKLLDIDDVVFGGGGESQLGGVQTVRDSSCCMVKYMRNKALLLASA